MSRRKSNRGDGADKRVGHDRRSFLKLSAGAAIGAASIGAPFVNAQAGTTLRFLNNETSAESQNALRNACNEYESKFGVKIVIDSTPISGEFAKTMAALNAGSPYDLATQGFIAHLLQYARAGHLVPLTDLVKKYSWGRMGEWQYQGENWFYPYDYNLVTVFYRKDLYAEKGLKVPNTWAEFLDNCRALTVSKDGNIERGGCVIPFASDSATNWASFGSLFAESAQLFDDKWNVVLDAAPNADRAGRFLDLYGELYKTMPPGMNTVSYADMMSLFVTGKAAHTSVAHEGINAIEGMAPVILALGTLNRKLAGRPGGAPEHGSLTVSLISGGTGLNIVPERCTIAYDRRTVPGDRTPALLAELDAALDSVRAAIPAIQVERKAPSLDIGALLTPLDAPIVRAAAAANAELGLDPAPTKVPYGSDASTLSAGGIPTIVYGPGDIAQAHSAREYVELNQVERAAHAYLATIRTFASGG